MEETLPVKEKLYDSSKIPNVCGVELSESQRNALEFGERVFLSNMKREDGSVIDGEVFLKPGKDNQPEMHFNFKREELVIPDKLLGKKLTDEEKTTLENGRMVGPIKHKEGEFYLQADLKLNQIVIKSDKELGIKNEIGGYKFTDSEKLMLAEGGKLGARVYKGEQGYFVAEMQMTADKRGITVSNIKSITNNEAKELIQKLNFPEQEKPKNVLEGAAATFAEGLDNKEKEKANLLEGVVNTVTNDVVEKPILQQEIIVDKEVVVIPDTTNKLKQDDYQVPINADVKLTDSPFISVLEIKNPETETLNAFRIDKSINDEVIILDKGIKGEKFTTFDIEIVGNHDTRYREGGEVAKLVIPNNEAAQLENKVGNKIEVKGEKHFVDFTEKEKTVKTSMVIHPTVINDSKLEAIPNSDKHINPELIKKIGEEGFRTRELTEAIDNKDFKKLSEIASRGIKPSSNDIARLNNNGKLGYEEKVAIATVLKLDPKEAITEIKKDIESNVKSAKKGKSITINQRQENKIKM